jgi:2-polyprenyl-3-methyl-5-hydroxy-6-metoxy-1,4-benzoquinol methylase
MLEQPQYYQFTRSDVSEFLPNYYEKVLDIGCGEGHFKRNLNESCEIWGIEPTNAADVASKNLYKVLNGYYQDVYDELPDNYFDLVVCNDVIEHMNDHDKFLKSIQKKITENGCIVGSIPNVRYIYNLYELMVNKEWFYDDSGVLDRTHLRFFTENSLTRTLNEHGYLIEKLHGINSELTKPLSFNIIKRKSLKAIVKRALLLFVIVGTFGFWNDVQYLQFAFRIKKRKSMEGRL